VPNIIARIQEQAKYCPDSSDRSDRPGTRQAKSSPYLRAGRRPLNYQLADNNPLALLLGGTQPLV